MAFSSFCHVPVQLEHGISCFGRQAARMSCSPSSSVSNTCYVNPALLESSMCISSNGMPVDLKNLGQPIRSIHSPILSYSWRCSPRPPPGSDRLHRLRPTRRVVGGVRSRKLRNFGWCGHSRPCRHPERMPSFNDRPSAWPDTRWSSHRRRRRALRSPRPTRAPSTVAGRMAAVGQDAETFGFSHILGTFEWSSPRRIDGESPGWRCRSSAPHRTC